MRYYRDLYDNVSVIEQYNEQHPNYNFFFFTNPADSAAGKVRWNNSLLEQPGAADTPPPVARPGKPELELVADNTKPPRSNQWNMGVRQVLGENVLSATYTGVHSYNGFTYMCHNAFRDLRPGAAEPVLLVPRANPGWERLPVERRGAHMVRRGLFCSGSVPTRQKDGGALGSRTRGPRVPVDRGDLFSFDFRFPTDYPRYQAPNVQRNTFVGNWIR